MLRFLHHVSYTSILYWISLNIFQFQIYNLKTHLFGRTWWYASLIAILGKYRLVDAYECKGILIYKVSIRPAWDTARACSCFIFFLLQVKWLYLQFLAMKPKKLGNKLGEAIHKIVFCVSIQKFRCLIFF